MRYKIPVKRVVIINHGVIVNSFFLHKRKAVIIDKNENVVTIFGMIHQSIFSFEKENILIKKANIKMIFMVYELFNDYSCLSVFFLFNSAVY